ncbi:MAG: protein phosphatase 2C domain-containing protein [Chloroflexi bacterium]|nr:protein phosphatase 2C domain-containing protein [Chloroflexota bacterium]
MHISAHTFWMPKAGNRADEYEDAFAHTPLQDTSVPEFLCAVADGATETSFSGLWAQLLAAAFVERRLVGIDPATIARLSDDWRNQIAERTHDKPLPWYAEEKLQSGAYSSLVGLYLAPPRYWRAVGVGDSCLFQLRRGKIIRAFPLMESAQFNNRPALISTNAEGNRALVPVTVEGDWRDDDCFLLMTDALAQFFLAQREQLSRLLWMPLRDKFLRLRSQPAFDEMVIRLRHDRVCRNDDVTLVRVRVRASR